MRDSAGYAAAVRDLTELRSPTFGSFRDEYPSPRAGRRGHESRCRGRRRLDLGSLNILSELAGQTQPVEPAVRSGLPYCTVIRTTGETGPIEPPGPTPMQIASAVSGGTVYGPQFA